MTRAIPQWRQNAPAGVSLVQAAAMSGEAPAKLPKQLQTVIRPTARNRWLGNTAASYTPDRIEQVLRSAMTGSLVAQWELFDLMEDTWPRLTKNLNQLKRAVLAYERTFEPWYEEEEAAAPEADERARLISRAIWKMKPRADESQNGFDDTIYDILDAWAKGVAVLEIDWEVRDGGKFGMITAPQATRYIHPRFYGYPPEQDWLGLNTSEIDSAKIGSGPRPLSLDLRPVDGVYARFPQNKFLICVCRAKSGHPSVSALLRPLAFWWAAANFTQEWFLNFAQIFGLPIRWANYDPNTPGLLDSICDMLENMGSEAWGAFPAGTTLELKEPMKSGTDNPQVALINRADAQADILILGQSGTTEISGPGKDGGSHAANKVLEGVEAGIRDAAAQFVCRVINEQLIPMIELLNYGDNKLTPELLLAEAKQEDTKANAERDGVLMDRGVEMPKSWFYKRHQIPLPQEGEEVISGARRPDVGGQTADDRGRQPKDDDQNKGEDEQRANAKASRATEKLIDHALEDLTGVEARWLGDVKPFFRELIIKAQSADVSDAEFVRFLEQASKKMPELFGRLDHEAVAGALENAMSAALVNGAAKGFMTRRSNAREVQS